MILGVLAPRILRADSVIQNLIPFALSTGDFYSQGNIILIAYKASAKAINEIRAVTFMSFTLSLICSLDGCSVALPMKGL
jgi:Na+-driven multidrug efflux pump